MGNPGVVLGSVLLYIAITDFQRKAKLHNNSLQMVLQTFKHWEMQVKNPKGFSLN